MAIEKSKQQPWRLNVCEHVSKILTSRLSLDGALQRIAQQQVTTAHYLIAGFFRYYTGLEALRTKLQKRAFKGKYQELNLLVKLGIYELLFMHTAAHVVIHEWVEVAKLIGAPKPLTGAVNAILRNVERARDEALYYVKTHNHLPQWLQDRWQAEYGADTLKMMESVLENPPHIDLRFKQEADFEATSIQGIRCANLILRLKDDVPHLTTLAGFANGAWWVQSFASSMVPQLFEGSALDILDLCAAPGGKTALLAANGHHVYANDMNETRLDTLRMNLNRLRLKAEITCYEGVQCLAHYAKQNKLFDGILIDAPCAATGTIRKHPELPYIKSQQDVYHNVEIQKQLLDKAANLLKPQGVIVYSVCSLEPEEGVAQVEHFLKNHPEFKRKMITEADVYGKTEVITLKGDMLFMPHYSRDIGGEEGLYAARLVKY